MIQGQNGMPLSPWMNVRCFMKGMISVLENDKISFLSWEATAALAVHRVPYSWLVLRGDLCHSYLCRILNMI